MKKDLEFKILASIAFLSPFLMCGEEWMYKFMGYDKDMVLLKGYSFITLPVIIIAVLFLGMVWSRFFSKRVIMFAGVVSILGVMMSIFKMMYESNLKYVEFANFTIFFKTIERYFFTEYYISLSVFALVLIGFLIGVFYKEKTN